MDEGWAIYAGDGNPTCNMVSVPEMRNTLFGTSVNGTCTSKIAADMASAFNDALEAAKTGDVVALTAARDAIAQQFVITYIQATIMYADKLDSATDLTPAAIEGTQAEAYTFFWTIAPMVANVDAGAAKKIIGLIEKPEPGMTAKVVAAFEGTFEGLGIEAADVGTLNAEQQGLVCNAAADTPSAASGAGRVTGGVVAGVLGMLWALL